MPLLAANFGDVVKVSQIDQSIDCTSMILVCKQTRPCNKFIGFGVSNATQNGLRYRIPKFSLLSLIFFVQKVSIAPYL